MLETLMARSARARQRGRAAWLVCAARESAALLWTAIVSRCRVHGQGVRSSRRLWSPDAVVRETQYAARRLRTSPGFTVTAVLMLGVTMAAGATSFALVSRVLLSPLPYPAAERLVALDHAAPALGAPDGMGMSIGLFNQYRTLPSIEAVALYTPREATVHAGGGVHRQPFLQATAAIGELTGAGLRVGRWFEDGERRLERPDVAVVTARFAERHFGSDTGTCRESTRRIAKSPPCSRGD